MAKLEHYALDYDAIEATLEEFFSDKEGYSYAYEKVEDYIDRVVIGKEQVKKPGILRIYNKQGLYCMVVEGTPSLKTICNECKSFIIERLQIPSAIRQSFSVKNVDAELAEACLVCLGENYIIGNDLGDISDARHYIVRDNHRSSVSVILYNNGTIFVQGAYTALFLKVITEISKETSAAPEAVVEELMRISPLLNKRYDIEIDKLIHNPKPIKDNHLDVMVLSSVVQANGALPIGDYSGYSFGILKAIEGLLALKLQAHFNKDTDPFSCCFSPDTHGIQRLSVSDFDAPEQAGLKTEIENAYNFYNNNRHSTFHVKKLHVETSRILTFDEAIDIIDDGIELINRLCDNW